MWNIMLDEKPDQWNGYPVNTDFRIGIQISQLMNDMVLTDRERFGAACELLFPGITPPLEEIQEALEWYLNGWYLDGAPGKKGKDRVVDYDIDQWRIYSAFRAQYGIDLNIASLHYWEFMGLLTNLEECAYTRVVGIRQKKVAPKMSKEEKKALAEAKKIYSLEAPKEGPTAEDEAIKQEIINDYFLRRRGGET